MANNKTTVWQHAIHTISTKLGFVAVSEADAETLVAANVAQRPKIGAYRFKFLNRTKPITASMSVAGAPFNEGGTFPFTITLSGAVTVDTTFMLKTAGVAVEGIDYDELPTQITIPAGAITGVFDCITKARSGAQGARTVIVTIESYESHVSITGETASFTILDV